MVEQTVKPMNLNITENNFIIFLSANFFEGKNNYIICKTKRFHFAKTHEKLIEKIIKIYQPTNSESKNKTTLTIKLYDIRNHKSKEFKSNISKCKSKDGLVKCINDVRDKIFNIKGIIDTKSNKFRVEIINYESQKIDKRGFSFNSDLDKENLLKELKVKMDKILERENNDDIVFTNEKVVNKTHRIVLYKCGTTNSHLHTKSKSFTIKLSNFSSSEIVNLLRGRTSVTHS